MQEKEFTFQPDQVLINFAEEFSRAYKTAEPRQYTFLNGKYCLKTVRTFGQISANPVRVNINTKEGELNLSILQSGRGWVTPDLVFYFILWCFCLIELINNQFDEENILMEADLQTVFWYCTKTNRSKVDMLHGILQVYNTVPSALNKNRAEKIIELRSNIIQKQSAGG